MTTTHSIKRKRDTFLKTFAKQRYLKHHEKAFWHGRLLAGTEAQSLQVPRTAWLSHAKPRDDHETNATWLDASEYKEEEDSLKIKVDRLAELLQMSRKTVVYSGAGISRAAGIGQAARGSSGPRENKTTTALPTLTHYALAALAKRGLIHGWVQQNHDGLPQKAGFPQEHINEIHGSWYDPANPVVLYSGQLREYECDWMVEDAKTADLALVLGTSLGGLNADQVALKTASRSRQGKALGSVMINLQQTEQDGKMTLRIFEESDNIFRLLLQKLDIIDHIPKEPADIHPRARQVWVPYDENGKRSRTVEMHWDLSKGAKIKLAPGHNTEGAGQVELKGPGHGKVSRWNNQTCAVVVNIEGHLMLLGQWWLEAAKRGGPPTLPIVNTDPQLVVVVEGEGGSEY